MSLREFSIPFVGLKSGLHRLHYEVGDEFFAHFENNEIKGSKVTVDLDFDKREGFFILDFHIGGHIAAECDRCLQNFEQELLDEHRVYVKFDDEAAKEDEDNDVVFISRSETHLDVSKLIYDFVNLSIPVQKICPAKPDGRPGCNKKILEILDKKSKNEKQQEEPDPRWSALKKLK